MSFRDKGNRVLLPFGLDYADITQASGTQELKYPLPINGPITNLEDEAAKQFTNFAELMKNGSFYTGTLESGVNDGLKRYSDKYRKTVKTGRSIDEHPFVAEFFPEELHQVFMGKNKDKKKKSLAISNYTKGVDKDMAELIKLSEEDKQKNLMERLNNVDENEEENEVDAEEEEEDDEFEEDDDDDYNAEKYFDDGDDYGDDDGGDEEAAF
ncbi:hypothetical protein CANARDRAFT_236738 [[Candida] arabinofermentans NRRL YB-2248]|uniref:DNA-directed RNA polymerase III subunit n=1 Tax=[Candida] arabinofermentans NRRL YB-2248 TaxID=983967 RepID=A0A1E4SWT9_9ASCO|nr:hypothetical protein CANARDRAFT_236738 [[Candida] arabinofermentans NRRL YB-2248]